MFYKRDMHNQLTVLASHYPVVMLTGPRFAGKTTLVRETFPGKPYVNLESIQTLRAVEDDPVGFLILDVNYLFRSATTTVAGFRPKLIVS